MRNINVELLLGKEVKDSVGRRAGRIEEIRAQRIEGEIIVEAYHLGPEALLERLAAPVFRMGIFRAIGLHKHVQGRRARWEQMDLSNPEKPVLRCTLEEIATFAR